jgi:molybdopterin-synthase adenylyltransferase
MDRLVFPYEIWEALNSRFGRPDGREEGAFLQLGFGRTPNGVRLLARSVIFADGPDDWESQGPDNLRPSGRWMSRAFGAAMEADAGLAFIHSHPGSTHPAQLSPLDMATSRAWAPTLLGSLEGPFASLVWTRGAVEGVCFDQSSPTRPRPISRIQALGAGATVWLSRANPTPTDALDDRQERAVSQSGNVRLRDLDIVVVGAGGTGSSLAVRLARVGVRSITLIDPDRVDNPSNVRRIAGSSAGDVALGRSKVDVVANYINHLDLGTKAVPLHGDVRTSEGLALLINTDLLLNTTDTHSSRAFVNQVALQYWVPTLDVGVRIGTTAGTVSGMPAEVRLLLPDNGCLWCRGVIAADVIRAENLPAEERTRLAQEGYVTGPVGLAEPSIGPLNSLAADLVATSAIKLTVGGTEPGWWIVDPWEHYEMTGDAPVDPSCVCHIWRSAGDAVQVPVISR